MFRSTLTALFGMAAVATLAGCPAKPPPDPVVPPSAEVTSFSASASAVAPGTEVTLSWETVDAKSIALTTDSGQIVDVSSADPASGSVVVKPTENTRYVLTARGEGGSDTASVPVAIQRENEEVFFAVFPGEVTAGDEVSIVWNVPGAESVHIEDASGTVVYDGANATGSTIERPNFSTTFTLTAGGRKASADVKVGPAVLAFEPAAPAVAPGGTITLSWKAGGATEISLESEGRGVIHSTSTQAEIADGTFSEPVPAIAADHNGLVHYRLVARNEGLEAAKEVTVYSGTDPLISQFTVPTYAKIGGAFQVSWKTLEADSLSIFVDGEEVFATQDPAKVASGNAPVASPSVDGEVTLVARNTRGGSDTETKPITVVGDLVDPQFTVDEPVLAQPGLPAKLTWSVGNARHVKLYEVATGKILEEVTGLDAESGDHTVYPSKQTTYALFAENLVGDVLSPELTQTVDLTLPAELIFSPTSAPEGTVVQLTGSNVPGGGVLRPVNFVVKDDPSVSFVDITTTGTAVPGVVADNDYDELYADFGAPFSTVIMGTPVTAHGAIVSPDGNLVFSDAPDSTGYPSSFPSTSGEPLQVLAFADDLETGNDTQILWQIDGTGPQQRLIVQWNNIYEYPYTQSPTKKLTFQAQIYADGQVNIVFDAVIGYTTSDKGLIGLKNAEDTDGLQVYPEQFANGIYPAAGDRFSFFGTVPLPTGVVATAGRSYTVTQEVNGITIEITGAPTVTP